MCVPAEPHPAVVGGLHGDDGAVPTRCGERLLVTILAQIYNEINKITLYYESQTEEWLESDKTYFLGIVANYSGFQV